MAIGPLMQVAIGDTVALATGSAGNVDGALSVCHVHVAGSAPVPASCGSLTLNGLSTTSPTFSAVKRKYTCVVAGLTAMNLRHGPVAVSETSLRRLMAGFGAVTVRLVEAVLP